MCECLVGDDSDNILLTARDEQGKIGFNLLAFHLYFLLLIVK